MTSPTKATSKPPVTMAHERVRLMIRSMSYRR